jgi:hypothetical protein
MDGSATFTIVLSRPTMNRLRQQMARMSSRRWRLSSGRVVHLERGSGTLVVVQRLLVYN